MKTMSVPGSLYSVSPAEYQAKSLSPPTPMGASGPSFGPLMNPSSETESPVRTLPMLVLLPRPITPWRSSFVPCHHGHSTTSLRRVREWSHQVREWDKERVSFGRAQPH